MGRKSVRPKLQFKMMLNKQPWVVKLYTHRNFVKKWKNCVAITEYLHKKNDLSISFKGPIVSRDTIAHELMHAYLSYKDFTKLTPHTIEERVCEVIGKKHKTLYLLTNKVYSIFKQGRINASKKKEKVCSAKKHRK